MTDAPRAPRPLDVAIAAGCWVISWAGLLAVPMVAALEPAPEAVFGRAPTGGVLWWLTVATFTVQALALLWAWAAPRGVLLVVTGIPVLLAVAAPGPVFSLTTLAPLVATFVAVAVVSLRRLRVALPSAALLLMAGDFINLIRSEQAPVGAAAGSAALQALLVTGMPLLIGLVVASRRGAKAAHERELRALARERDALVRAAVAGERTAMARELHDIAAHHMSGIALMAAAIERQIDTDPSSAKRSVADVRAQSTAVLEDLRRLVGLLRDDEEATRSVETLAAVGELVQRRTAAGAVVEHRRLDAPDREAGAGIGPLAQLVVFRMVQEALANAALHAPGARAVVELDDRDAAQLTVRVHNAAPVPTAQPIGATPDAADRTDTGGGFGLVGMRERADLVGATLSYGDTADGGWEVRLLIPRETERPEPTETAVGQQEDGS